MMSGSEIRCSADKSSVINVTVSGLAQRSLGINRREEPVLLAHQVALNVLEAVRSRFNRFHILSVDFEIGISAP